MHITKDLVYRIDSEDRLVHVGPTWDPFAVSNGGEAALSQHVVGRSLWDFIADPTTCHLYQQLAQRVRTGVTVVFPFRCDSATRRRSLEMTMRPLDDNGVEFNTRILGETERVSLWPDVHVLQPNFRPVVRSCGWCKKIDVQGAWFEMEVAVDKLALFEQSVPPDLTHGMCEACFDAISQTLS